MELPRVWRCARMLCVAAVFVMMAGGAYADPIRIATVQALWSAGPSGEVVVVDLASNPGVILTGQQVDFGPEVRAVVTFEAILAGRQSGSLIMTFDWPEGWAPPFSHVTQEAVIDGADVIVFGMDFPILYQPVPLTLTLSASGEPGGGIEGPSTFTFSVVQPTPEPATALLCGSALAAIMVRRRLAAQRAFRQHSSCFSTNSYLASSANSANSPSRSSL